MNKKISFSTHILSLSAIFILGNGALIFPLKATDSYGFLAYLISFSALAVFYPIVSLLCDKISIKSETAYGIVILTVGVLALFAAANTFRDLMSFISAIMLPQTPKFFIALLLGGVSVYFALKPYQSILKFALLSFVLIIGVILFFFSVQTDKYDLRNIYIFRMPDFGGLISQVKNYLFNPILCSLILPIFLKLNLNSTHTKQGFWGVVIGGGLLGLCILMPILLFTPQLSGELEFPFSSAVSTVTVGRLFTRLDGFAYYVFFATSVVKITVCLKTVLTGLKTIDKIVKEK